MFRVGDYGNAQYDTLQDTQPVYVSFIRVVLCGWGKVRLEGVFFSFNSHQNQMDPHLIWPWVQWSHCIDLFFFSKMGPLLQSSNPLQWIIQPPDIPRVSLFIRLH